MSDSLQGVLDSNNQKFTVSYEFVPGQIEIIYNGQVLTSPIDFEETGSKEITFVYLKPDETTVLKANYMVGDCGGDSGLISSTFLELEDTPDSYTTHAGKILSVSQDENSLSFIDFEPGSTNFISLTDTPTTYSGFENHYLKVNAAGDGIDFFLPDGDVQEGITNIPIGSTTVDIIFNHEFSNDNFILTVSLENKVDLTPSVYPTLIRDKTITGFTVEFSGDIDSNNYYLNWIATLPGSGFSGMGGSGISAVVEDSTPELGGHLNVGSNLILLDPSPNGLSLHGYDIGYSGDASEMYVYNNPTGFGCPLYMKPSGQWAACTAVSGTVQMPCGALALEEDDGAIKKILWKGIIKKGSWSWIPGQVIYISTVEGALTNVKPNGGSWLQPVGLAIASNTIRFDPGFNPGDIN
jgi:hypothetical protein